jgi:glycine cleavage system transcriptional repressor
VIRRRDACHNAAVTLHAITVLGRDRPGIIAEATEQLAGLGLNLEDSSMTLLRGHFAMTLICAGDASPARVEEALAPLAADGSLTVTVREVSPGEVPAAEMSPWVLTVHGGDRTGIVASIVAEVARVGGNVTDLTTRLAGDLYLLVAEIALPASADADALAKAVDRVATGLGVEATLRPADTDEL